MAKASTPLDREAALRRLSGIDKEHLTHKELVWVTGVHEVTAYRWVQQGRLKAYRQTKGGKRNVYKREDVETFVRGRSDEILPAPIGARASEVQADRRARAAGGQQRKDGRVAGKASGPG